MPDLTSRRARASLAVSPETSPSSSSPAAPHPGRAHGMRPARRRVIGAGLATAALVRAGPGLARDYPNRPVKIIVPFPAAGGPLDTAARLFAEQLQRETGQVGIVENRAGAGGLVGTSAAFQAAPDGYTLLCATGFIYGLGRLLFDNPDIDPQRLAPIGMAVSYPAVLVSRPGLPISNAAEFIAHARANPGKLSYGSQGTGTIGHLSMEQIKRDAGIDLLHVPFRGSNPAVAGILSGTVDVLIDSLTNTLPHIQADKLKLVAVATPSRLAAFPQASAIAEALPGFDASVWVGFAAPPGTPGAIVDRLNGIVQRMLARPGIEDNLASQHLSAIPSTPADMQREARRIDARWAAVARTIVNK